MPPPTKRRRTEPTVVEEITFDLAARQDYLTGFHKRKVQRAKHAQEVAERRARVERLEERKKVREERKAELERHVEEVNAMLRPVARVSTDDESEEEAGDSAAEEWDGISDSEPPVVDHEAEYIDEDKYTTVTVATMDVSKEGLFQAQQEKDGQDTAISRGQTLDGNPESTEHKKRPWTKEKPKNGVKKHKKKRNFRYEGKAERKEARSKEKSKNRKQARERRADRS